MCYLPAGNSRRRHPKGSFKWPQFHQSLAGIGLEGRAGADPCWDELQQDWGASGRGRGGRSVQCSSPRDMGPAQSHCLHLPRPELG